MRVTAALTELADVALRAALRFLMNDATRRGKLNPQDKAQPEMGPAIPSWRWARWARSN